MKYRINGAGWPVGQYLIPSGSVIDSTSDDHWSLFARGLTPPINCQALDDEAHQALQNAYTNVGPEGWDLRHLLGPPPPGSSK